MSSKFVNIHQELLFRCEKGDSKAQFEIYRLYYKPMYNSSLRIVGATDIGEDIMQESFLTAFGKLKSYSGYQNPYTQTGYAVSGGEFNPKKIKVIYGD